MVSLTNYLVMSTALLILSQAAVDGGYFGNRCEWNSLKDGMQIMKQENKPGVVIIYKSWSGACRGLGKRIASDSKFSVFAKRYVMILVADDDEPEDEKWFPDGDVKYYPRVFFVNPDSSIDYEVNNAGFSPVYHYYYYDSDSLHENMIKYLENHGQYDRDLSDIASIENDYEVEL